jgi:hypothetical protein
VLQLAVQPVEERLLEDEAGLDVVSGQRQQARLDLLRMLGGVDADPVGIGLHDLAQVGGQLAVVGVGGRPDVEQSGDVVGRRGGWRPYCGPARRGWPAQRPAGCRNRPRSGRSQAESGVGVGLAQHVRHAPVVAAYADVIGLGLGQQGVAGRDLGQAHAVDDDQCEIAASTTSASSPPIPRRIHFIQASPTYLVYYQLIMSGPASSWEEPVSTNAG